MGKKGRGKKGRTRRNNEASRTQEPEQLKRAAHSFVVARGRTGKYVSQLVLNFRRVMEPFTASQLRTKGTTVRDLASVAGPLGVTHLCLFTRSQIATYMKLAKFPRGPTLTFRVEDYTLSRDVLHSLRRAVTYSRQFQHGPLLILSGFSCDDPQLQLTATMLQNMFPVLNVHKVKLNDLRRAVLFSYSSTEQTITFRHYAVKVTPAGLSRGVRKLVSRAEVPNMGRLQDMADFVARSGYASESEGEEDASCQVQLAQPVSSRGNMVNARSAVKLIELGPRLTLKLMKAEAGLVEGEVLYHRLVTRTEEQREETRRRREQRQEVKAQRRAQQRTNVERKAALREQMRQRSLDGMKRALSDAAATGDNTEDEPDPAEGSDQGGDRQTPAADDSSAEDADGDDPQTAADDDADWYRREVGHEPDQEFLSLASAGGGGAVRTATKRFTKRRAPSSAATAQGSKRTRREPPSQPDGGTPRAKHAKHAKHAKGAKGRRKTAARGRR